MTNIKTLEKKFDKQCFECHTNCVGDKHCQVKAFYRQAIMELMLEVAGSDLYVATANKDKIEGYNLAKAEIKMNINKMFEEK